MVAANTAIGTLEASMLDTATTSSMHEQHEGARAVVDADRMDEDEHPGQPEEQIEHDEAQPPGAEVDARSAARRGTAGTW